MNHRDSEKGLNHVDDTDCVRVSDHSGKSTTEAIEEETEVNMLANREPEGSPVNTVTFVGGDNILGSGGSFESTSITFEKQGLSLPTTNGSPIAAAASIRAFVDDVNAAPVARTGAPSGQNSVNIFKFASNELLPQDAPGSVLLNPPLDAPGSVFRPNEEDLYLAASSDSISV